MNTNTATVLKRALPSAARRAPGVLIGILADGCIIGLLALSMWLIVRAGEQPPILWLTFAIVGVRALAIGRAAFRYVERLASHDAAFDQLADLRTETFQALVPRMPGVIDTQRRGDILTGFVDDVDQLQDEALRVRQPFIVSSVITLLSIAVIAAIEPIAAVIIAVCLIIAALIAVITSHRIAGISDTQIAELRGTLTDALLERFEAAHALAAFGALDRQRARIRDAQSALDLAQRRSVKAAGLTQALMTFGSGLATVLTLIAISDHLQHGLTAPMFAAIVIVPAAVAEVFVAAPTAVAARRKVLASAHRVAQLTDVPIPKEIPREQPNNPNLPAPVENSPLLSVRNFSVRHVGSVQPAVRNVNFSLNPGQTLVITGDSGSGKTTLALALVGLLAHEGSFEIQGRNVHDFGTHQLREIVGLAEQRPYLFDSDLRQNLKFADPLADDDTLMSVLDRVGLAEWANARGGLDARLGERGALVSGGQAQRIALARAILADFPVVIFDEPTAGVDRQLAQQLILDLLGAVPENRAVILITHTDIPESIRKQSLHISA